MTDPLKINLSITPDEQIPIEHLYAEREKALLEEQWNALITPAGGETTAINATDAGLAKNADAAAAQPPSKPTPPIESVSEQVRNKAQADLTKSPIRSGVDAVLKSAIGIGLDELQSAVEKGTLPEKVSMKWLSPGSNIVGDLARQHAEASGLAPEVADKIASAAAIVASILYSPSGGVPAQAMKAGEKVAGAAEKVAGDPRIAQLMAVLTNQRGALGGDAGKAAKPAAEGGLDIASKYLADVAAQRRGVRPHTEAMTEAQALKQSGMTLDDVRALMPGTALNDSEATAVILHLMDSGMKLKELAKHAKTDPGALTPLIAQLYEHAQLDPKRRGVIAEGGRTLSVMNDPVSGMNQFLKQFEELFQNGQGFTPQRLAELIDSFKTPEELAKFATTIQRPGLFSLVYEYWINSLLSGPQTHAANLSSNAMTAAWAPAERFLSALGDIDAVVKGQRSVFFGESAAMLYGMVEGVKDGLRLVGKSIREGAVAPTFGADKVEKARAFRAETFHLDPNSALGGFADLMGTLINAPTSALRLEDGFFKALNFQMELHALAYREASHEGRKGAAFWKRVGEITRDPEKFPAAKSRAEQFAVVNTFNADFSDLGTIGKVGQGVASLADALPGGRIILPFTRTPTNITHFAVERTPLLNALSDTLRADLAAGGERRALAMGKVGASAMIAGAFAMYGTAAIAPDNPVPFMTVITGAGPKDAKERANLDRLGWKPFSVWNPLSKEYVAYGRLDPLGMMLGVVSTASEILGQIPQWQADELAMAVVLSTSRALVNKTYMQGLSDFLTAMQGDGKDIRRFFEGLARSTVPAAVRQVNRTEIDPMIRETFTLLDQVRSGLPLFSTELPPRRNLWGDTVMVTGGLGPDLISPVFTSPVKDDPVSAEMAKQRVKVTMPPKWVTGSKPGDLHMTADAAGHEGVPLTPPEYDRLVLLMGKAREAGEINGVPLGALGGQPPLKDKLAELMASDAYNRLPQYPSDARALMIQKIVQLYKDAAELQLRRESPYLEDAITARRTEKLRMRQLQPAPVTTPGAQLLKTLGR